MRSWEYSRDSTMSIHVEPVEEEYFQSPKSPPSRKFRGWLTSITENWDGRLLNWTLVFTCLLTLTSFVIAWFSQIEMLGIQLKCHHQLKWDTQRENEEIRVGALISLLASYVIAFCVGIYVVIQCSRSAEMMLRYNVLLTSAFILPCYKRVWMIYSGFAFVGICFCSVFLGGPERKPLQTSCTYAEVPLIGIKMLLPVLLLQQSVSKQAIYRSLWNSILVAVGYMIIVLTAWKKNPVVFGSLLCTFHLVFFGFICWVWIKRNQRVAFGYVFAILGLSSILSSIQELMYSINQEQGKGAAILSIVSCIVVAFNPLGTLLTLRADTKYWLGTDSVALRASESELQSYFRQTATVGMLSSFSTRTSVYGVHCMIEESRQHMVNFALLKLEKIIAQGATAIIFNGTYRTRDSTTCQVAVKMYTTLQVSEDDVYRFSKEADINVQLSHPNIVKFLGLCVVPPTISLVFEFCEYGSLDDYLKMDRSWCIVRKLRAWLDAAKAVAYLHSFSPPLLHRDIKTGNFLLSSDFVVKLTDFGEAHLLRPRNDGTMTIVGTVSYMSPELMLATRSAVYDTASDIYSLSMCLWEIYTPSQVVWDGKSNMQIYNAVLEGQRPFLHPTMPEKCRSLLHEGWAKNPKDRPTAADLVESIQEILALSQHRQQLKRTK